MSYRTVDGEPCDGNGRIFPRRDYDLIDPRIASVEAQILACMRGATNVITCPFCKAQNTAENAALCCVDFGAVVNAVLRKQAQQEILDTARRVADAIAKN